MKLISHNVGALCWIYDFILVKNLLMESSSYKLTIVLLRFIGPSVLVIRELTIVV